MNKRIVLFTPLVLTIALGLILYTAIGKDPTKLETARLNDPVPKFQLSSLSDQNKQLNNSVFSGEVMLLNVWATWCPSCRVEHPYLNTLSEQGVKIAGLNYKDERDAAQVWLAKLGNPYTFNIYDPEGKLGFDLGVYGAPETYIIDQHGYVRHRHVGVVDDKVWHSTLKPLIDKLEGKVVL
ncbi:MULTISPECIES: DsbE family thiol:disulfide interchange protein [unclassified Oleiphilus]|jgi:cytochrome c biogenesis protein CcmG/thiol:disulfide interchange protein DsbE|uniref:DsbE family thiol:disulfide interchange protein n=3 Tax=Oleiphilus TaxID=141450 RepID=UPI0007C3A6ED|nr:MULTISPECIES: DsbE family thiol:disulfide interchange protein [unclassified Oleiphilus]KZY40359.1 thiol:disulfide interchange protein [Oleiphilus sp. HI0050]KZY81301.1 thiol:disulfide interchange protein [Oleiphilus sp. HI0069]KZY86744.1 thiol:disulfide interchange protein [Oleiphilus sp. HI0072]KZZ16650.1 thiol:disulfide interchange protein [Oleiphilus sp. HI0078]KZZ38987.1 thiol:disulfide interchange protein [Oleiphilus sp. HI0085]